MAYSSHARSNVLINLFDLPSLPDEKRTLLMIYNFPNNFYLPDGKNSKIHQIIKKMGFDRQTHDGSEGVRIDILYLECAYSTRFYDIDTMSGNISGIHKNRIKPTYFFGHFGPFNLKELEFDVCRIADHHDHFMNSRI